MILKEGKTNWVFLAIFIILSIIFGGEIIYNAQETNKDLSLLEKPLELKIEPVKPSFPSSEKIWKDYQNEDFGISFKYPKDWEVSLGSCFTPFWGVSGNCLRIEDPKDKNCALYIAKVDDTQYQDILSLKNKFGEKEVEIGGEKAVKINKEGMPYLLKTQKGNFVLNPMGEASCQDKILTIIKELQFSL